MARIMECAELDGACFLFGLKGAVTDTQLKSGFVDLHSVTVNICAEETVYLLHNHADVRRGFSIVTLVRLSRP